MHRLSWKPDCFGENYAGHIVLKRLKNTERMSLISRLGLGQDKEKLLAGGLEVQTDFLIQAYEAAKAHLVLGCEVKRVADGKALTFEDLEFEARLSGLVDELARAFMQGIEPGNEIAPQSDLT